MQLKQESPLLLYGNWVDENGEEHEQEYIFVQDGIIQSISAERPANLPENTLEYHAGSDAYIFPGFINLHTHVDWNLFPMWGDQDKPWGNKHQYACDNRFQWRDDKNYHAGISAAHHYVADNWDRQMTQDVTIGTAFQLFSEIQAVAGGTTVLQENVTAICCGAHDPRHGCHGTDQHTKYEPRKHALIRNTGSADDLKRKSGEVFSCVQFYTPQRVHDNRDPEKEKKPLIPPQDTSDWELYTDTSGFNSFKALEDSFNDYEAIDIVLVHLAEGRAGNQDPRGVDAYTRKEFDAFKRYMDANRAKYSKVKIGLIHGCGMDLSEAGAETTIEFLKDHNIGLVWSPVSNLLLYGDTVDATKFLDRPEDDVLVCLGSDWSPSGSKNVCQEAQLAYWYLTDVMLYENPNLRQRLYRMITTQPAKLLGIDAGSIKVGNWADFAIMDRVAGNDTPLDALFDFSEFYNENINAVVNGGVLVYGNHDVFEDWGIEGHSLPAQMGNTASQKCINLPSHLKTIDLDHHLTTLKQLLNESFAKAYGQEMQFSLPLSEDDRHYQAAIHELEMRFTQRKLSD